MAPRSAVVRTPRLVLARPVSGDVDALHEICADARLWWHYPTLRHTAPAQTAAMVDAWQESWDALGLGVWAVRLRADDRLIGYGGGSDLGGVAWNLGYRIAADEQGSGYATELARAGIAAARRVDPAKPVVAYLLAHNTPSASVARKVGLSLVDEGPDAGNPDTAAVRQVYADRTLSPDELEAARR